MRNNRLFQTNNSLAKGSLPSHAKVSVHYRNKPIYYAVSKSIYWDKSEVYSCPRGYYCARTQDGKRIFGSIRNRSGIRVYNRQCSWTGNNYAGYNRYFFRFFKTLHQQILKNTLVTITTDTSNLAGIVCHKESA